MKKTKMLWCKTVNINLSPHTPLRRYTSGLIYCIFREHSEGLNKARSFKHFQSSEECRACHVPPGSLHHALTFDPVWQKNVRLEHALNIKYNSQINTSKPGLESDTERGSALRKSCGIAYEATMCWIITLNSVNTN